MAPAGRDSMLAAARTARSALANAVKALSGRQHEARAAELASITGKLFALEALRKNELDAAFADALASLRTALNTLQHDPNAPFDATEQAAQALDVMFTSLPARNVPPPGIPSGVSPTHDKSCPRPHDSVRPRRHTMMELRSATAPEDAVRLQADLDYLSENNFYAGLSNNIDWGGVFISTWRPLPVGTDVVVALRLPNGHRFEAAGRVVWVRDGVETAPGMGVAFRHLAPSDRAHVDSFMQQRPPIFYEP